MARLVFFAVGGSGLRAVEPLLYLCGLGLGPDHLRLVLIDPDQTHPAGKRATDLLNLYRRIRKLVPRADGTRYFHTDIDVAHEGVWSPIARQHGGGQAIQTFHALVDADDMRSSSRYLGHLFDLLYDPQDEQQMPLEKGFRGRPSIGTVFMNRIARAPWLRPLLADSETSFFVAGSVFGGTGASALPVISDVLRRGLPGEGSQKAIAGVDQGRVGGALLLPYFRPIGGTPTAADDGIMPDPATFALNTRGAMPYYLDSRSGFGEMFTIGESAWRETTAAVGGPEQDNGPHHVELLAALAALDFAGRAERTTFPRFWAASAAGQNVRLGDLPMPEAQRRELSAGLVWAHTLLTYFGSAEGVDSELALRFHGATWLEVLGLDPRELQEGGLHEGVHSLCEFAECLWEWSGAVSDLRRAPSLLLRGGQAGARGTLFSEILAGATARRSVAPPTRDGMEIFRGWNTAAAELRKRGETALLEVMRRGSEEALKTHLVLGEVRTGTGSGRFLLPALEEDNLKPDPGRWSEITASRHYLKRIRSQDDRAGIIVRGGSIPNPWARMLLFEDALKEVEHPARGRVANELLDILEFLWRPGAQEPAVRLVQFSLDDLLDDARGVGKPGVEEFAEALHNMYKWKSEDDPAAGLEPPRLTLVQVRDGLSTFQSVACSSPLTLLFTGMDTAHRAGRLGFGLFGEALRPLTSRQSAFRIYVTQLLQMPRGLVNWQAELTEEVRKAGFTVTDEEKRQLEGTREEHPVWFSGFALFRQLEELPAPSRWRMHHAAAGTAQGRGPYLVDPQTFDGCFYEGAPEVALPDEATLAGITKRDRLPGHDVPGEWASPRHHWFTDELVLLDSPLRTGEDGTLSVLGFRGFKSELSSDSPLPQAQPRFLLPLRQEVLKYLTPQQIDDGLRINVRASGDVAVSLTVDGEDPGKPMGKVPRTFQRIYNADSIRRAMAVMGSGPDIAIWPSFKKPGWKEYLIFRADVGQFATRVSMRAFAGRPSMLLEIEAAKRTEATQVVALRQAPEALVFSLTDTTGVWAELGLLLPFFREVQGRGTAWDVAVDFGTSNTTVCRRTEEGGSALLPLAATAVLLNDSSRLSGLVEAYFMPVAARDLYFGTALVHNIDLDISPNPKATPGVRTNIPWSGVLRDDARHRVYGDLKWIGTSDIAAQSRTAAFLRQLLAAIAASAASGGAESVRIFWSFPGAYTEQQSNAVYGLWKGASLDSETGGRYAGVEVKGWDPRLHESACTLTYFTAKKLAQIDSGVFMVFDVGGGTSDVAVYSDGRARLYDSVLLGGRNLTGGGFDGGPNPFVTRLLQLAHERSESDDALRAAVDQAKLYQANKQDHLAFSHLVSSRAFQVHQESYLSLEALQPFRGVVLYLFGALFFHAGLMLRGLTDRGLEDGKFVHGPLKLALAGNGSRYLRWAGFHHNSPAFVQFVKDCLAVGAGEGRAALPTELLGLGANDFLVMTEHPKQEVARGMLHRLLAEENGDRADAPPTLSATAGEHVMIGTQVLDPTSLLKQSLHGQQLGQVRFTGEALHVEFFNTSWLEAAGRLFAQDPSMRRTLESCERSLREMRKADIEERVRLRLAAAVAHYGEWRGSFFLVEVEAMLQKLLTDAFGRR